MLRIGLTGGIGSGKTTVAALFADHGAPVIDADDIVHRLMAPGGPAYGDIVTVFGNAVVAPDGRIDRAALRERVFNDASQRRTLESIVHPRVRLAIADAVATMDAPYCLIVVPLLFESGQDKLVDRVLVVDVEQSIQKARVATRSGLGREQIERIIAAQMDAAERRRRADDVLDNNGDLDALRRQVDRLHQRYMRLAAQQPHAGKD